MMTLSVSAETLALMSRCAQPRRRSWALANFVTILPTSVVLLSLDTLSADKARQVQRDLLPLAEFRAMAKSFDTLERACYLDSVLRLKAGNIGAWKELLRIEGDGIIKITRVPADWNIVLQRGNEFHNELVTAANTSPGSMRREALTRIRAKFTQMETDVYRRLPSLVSMTPNE